VEDPGVKIREFLQMTLLAIADQLECSVSGHDWKMAPPNLRICRCCLRQEKLS
jgi:hypothetical protein